jgi:hypothetical protein
MPSYAIGHRRRGFPFPICHMPLRRGSMQTLRHAPGASAVSMQTRRLGVSCVLCWALDICRCRPPNPNNPSQQPGPGAAALWAPRRAGCSRRAGRGAGFSGKRLRRLARGKANWEKKFAYLRIPEPQLRVEHLVFGRHAALSPPHCKEITRAKEVTLRGGVEGLGRHVFVTPSSTIRS